MSSAAIPNVCVVIRSNLDQPPLVGVYENRDPLSPSSTMNRSYRVTISETVSEGDSVAELVEKAKARLIEAAAPYELLSITHPYAPLYLGDAARVAWDDLDIRGIVQSMTIELDYPTRTRTELRREWQ